MAGAMLPELSTIQMMSTGCCSVFAFSLAVAQAASAELPSVVPKLPAGSPSPARPASATSVVGGASAAGGGSSPLVVVADVAHAGKSRTAPTADTRNLLDPIAASSDRGVPFVAP